MILDHDPMSNVYRLKCLKFETTTYSLTYSLTRVKSRDASASKKVQVPEHLLFLDYSYQQVHIGLSSINVYSGVVCLL